VTHYVLCIKCKLNDDNVLHIIQTHIFIGKYARTCKASAIPIESTLCDCRYGICSGKFLSLVDTTNLQEAGENCIKRSFIVYFRVMLYSPNNY
jgi:hypothetical protein